MRVLKTKKKERVLKKKMKIVFFSNYPGREVFERAFGRGVKKTGMQFFKRAFGCYDVHRKNIYSGTQCLKQNEQTSPQNKTSCFAPPFFFFFFFFVFACFIVSECSQRKKKKTKQQNNKKNETNHNPLPFSLFFKITKTSLLNFHCHMDVHPPTGLC